MFKQAILVCMLALGLGITTPAWATTYYTDKSGSDSNSCTNASNAASNRALAKLTIGPTNGSGGSSCLLQPGDNLIVGNGTYIEPQIDIQAAHFTNGSGGTQASPITIKAENQLLAILSSTSNSGGACAPNISLSASWIVIDGILSQIDPTDNNSGCTNNSANGVFVRMWSTNTPQLTGNQSTGNVGGTVRNCQVNASSHRSTGIKSNQDQSLVENCIMHAGLEGFNGLNQVFRGNTIDGPDSWNDHFTCKGGARNCQFYNNIVTDSVAGYSRGITLGGNTGCSGCWWDGTTDIECYNCVAYNNVLNITAGSSSYALVFSGTSNSSMFNNVIINGTTYMQQGGETGFPMPWPAGSTLENNIITCGGVAATSFGSATNTTTNYNDWFNCLSPPSNVNGISADPLFVNPASDWHLQAGSPAIGAGTVTSMPAYGGGSISVNLDKTGALRTIPWDMGIYKSAASNLVPKAPTGIRIF